MIITTLLSVPSQVPAQGARWVAIGPGSYLDAVSVNGRELRVGQVHALSSLEAQQALALSRADAYAHADSSPAAKVQLVLWTGSEGPPVPPPRRDVFRVVSPVLTADIGAPTGTPKWIVPTYGRRFASMVGRVLSGGPPVVDLYLVGIRYRGSGEACALWRFAAAGFTNPVWTSGLTGVTDHELAGSWSWGPSDSNISSLATPDEIWVSVAAGAANTLQLMFEASDG